MLKSIFQFLFIFSIIALALIAFFHAPIPDQKVGSGVWEEKTTFKN